MLKKVFSAYQLGLASHDYVSVRVTGVAHKLQQTAMREFAEPQVKRFDS